MDQEEIYFGENNNEDQDKEEDELYGDIPDEPRDLKTHSPKKRWKERHSGNNKEPLSHHRSPRRHSNETGREHDDDDLSSKGRRSSGDSTEYHHNHHRSRKRSGDDLSDENFVEGHKKSSRKHDDEDRYLKSKQKKLREKLRKIEAEDGEILEDGEIEDAEETGTKKQDSNTDPKKSERETSEKTDASFEFNEESAGEVEEEENVYDEGSKRKDRRRKHRDHGREKRRKSREDHYKKRKRRPDYVDHDKVNDDEMQQSWPGGNKKQSPKSNRRQESNHHGKRDKRKQRYHSPPGPYDSPYDSPPGPYDSPSYDEDSQEEFQQEDSYDNYKSDKDKRKQKKHKKSSMMSLMQGDDYLDANVAVDEGENLYKKREGGKKQKQKNYNKRKFDRQHSEQPQKKKPLLETPMDERPVCRFYKDGKCHKGGDCPFNHELTQKKPELCKYYLGGSCSKGDDCIFMHSEYPCKFYHTGQECFQGDNCKFSHDEPNEETEPIIERMNSFEHHDKNRDEEEFQCNKPRPGVLGSPPRHLKEQMDRIKKIPSLFDIQTFPPGQSPQKPPVKQGGQMNNSQQQRMQGPNQVQPQRPMGFYNDTMQGGMRGPPPGGPMAGPQGPMNMQIGPAGPVMGAPNQVAPPMNGPPQGPQMARPQGPQMTGPQGPMNMPPNSMGGPMQMGPPNSMGLMQQGPMQQGPMGGPMPRGQMGGPPMPMGQGPPMMNQQGMMGPGPQQGPMGGPPRMNNPAMNPALAIVGALLRHVNPQMAPQVSQAITGPQMQDPRQGMGILSPNSQGSDSQNPKHDINGPPAGIDDKNEEAYSPRDDDEQEEPKKKCEPTENDKGGGKQKKEEVDENEKKLAMMGLDLGSLSQLPPKQRELMMRLQQHGGQSEGEEEKLPAKKERKDDSTSEENKSKTKVDDDNWYSSDEDEGGTPKLTDVLKNLGKKESGSTAVEPSKSGSSINVMQMINAIKNQSGSVPQPPPVRDPRQRMDPRTVPHGPEPTQGGHMGFPHPADPRTFTSGLTVPPVNKWNSEPAIINSRPGDAEWRCIRITIDSSKRTEPPEGVNLLDPQFKNDPRIKKFLDNLNMKSHKENKNPHESGPVIDNKPVDPRSKTSALSEGPKDPRLKSSAIESKPIDPRLQRTISENSSSRANDPRMRGTTNPPSGVHNLPVRPVDPRSSGSPPVRSNDPRFSRQLSHDSSSGGGSGSMVLNVPKPSDPRLPPISLGEIASPSPSDILASLQYPTDSLQTEQKTEGFKRQNSVRDPRSKPLVDSGSLEQNDDQANLARQTSGGSDSETSALQGGDSLKAKIDYRNDPRFKVKTKKPGTESTLIQTQRRYGGQRKGSMEYSSPLDAESEQRDNSGGYNSYSRPQLNKPAVKLDPRTPKPDPRLKNENENMLPELPAFIPPEDENISTKHFFKQMDPTASPFC